MSLSRGSSLRRTGSIADNVRHSTRLLRFKQGVGEGHWKAAWLVLYRDGSLVWYNDKQCSHPVGETSVNEFPRRLKLGNVAEDDALSGKVPPTPVTEGAGGELLAIPGWSETEPTAWFWLRDEGEVRTWVRLLAAAVGKLRVFELYLEQHEGRRSRVASRAEGLDTLDDRIPLLATKRGDTPRIDWGRLWLQIIDFEREDLPELRASRISLTEDFVLVGALGLGGASMDRGRPQTLRERKRRHKLRPTRSLSPNRSGRRSRVSSRGSSAATSPPEAVRSIPAGVTEEWRPVQSPMAPPSFRFEDIEPREEKKEDQLHIKVSADVHHPQSSAEDISQPPRPTELTPPMQIHSPGHASQGRMSNYSAGGLSEDAFVRSPTGEVFLSRSATEEDGVLFQMSVPDGEEGEDAPDRGLYRESFKEAARPARFDWHRDKSSEEETPKPKPKPRPVVMNNASDAAMLAEVAMAMGGGSAAQKLHTADSFVAHLHDDDQRPDSDHELEINELLSADREEKEQEVASSSEEDAPPPAAQPTKVSFAVASDPAKAALRTTRIYRYKQGSALAGEGHWKEGWMVLYRDGNLVWYNDKHCSQLVGRTDIKEFPRRIKLGPNACDYPDVRGPAPPLPSQQKNPQGLMAIPAWTNTEKTTWIYVKEPRDWVAAFASALAKRDVFEKLAEEPQTQTRTTRLISNDNGRLERLGLLSADEDTEKEVNTDWAPIWLAVIDHGKAPPPVIGSGKNSAFTVTPRRRKRRSKLPHIPRPATPTAPAEESGEEADGEEEKTTAAVNDWVMLDVPKDVEEPGYEVIRRPDSIYDVIDSPTQEEADPVGEATVDRREEEDETYSVVSKKAPKEQDSGISTESPTEEDMDHLLLNVVRQQEAKVAARSAFFGAPEPEILIKTERSDTVTEVTVAPKEGEHSEKEGSHQSPTKDDAKSTLTTANVVRHSWAGEAAAVRAAVVRGTGESASVDSRYSSIESLVIDGVRISKAELLRRRLEESREFVIKSKLQFPPLGHKANGHAEPPPPVPTSPVPDILEEHHEEEPGNKEEGNGQVDCDHHEEAAQQNEPEHHAEVSRRKEPEHHAKLEERDEGDHRETYAHVAEPDPSERQPSMVNGHDHKEESSPSPADFNFRPIQDDGGTDAVDGGTDAFDGGHLQAEQIHLVSTDAESEEEDREFIAKALAANRKRLSHRSAKPDSPVDRDNDKTPEPEDVHNDVDATPVKGTTEATAAKKPETERMDVHTNGATEDTERAPASPVRVTKDYREGPLKPLTHTTSSVRREVRREVHHEQHRREETVVVTGRLVDGPKIHRVSHESQEEEHSSSSSVHHSVSSLVRAQEDVKLDQLNDMIERAKYELERNQRLRQQLEDEKERLASAAEASSAAAHLARRQRQLDEIFARANEQAIALMSSDTMPLYGGASSRVPVPAWQRTYPTPFRNGSSRGDTPPPKPEANNPE